MNDFLQSLRNGQAEKQRTPKTRKNFDNSYHYTSGPRFNSYGGGGGYQNNRSPQIKRPHTPHMNTQMPMDDGSTTSMLAEAIETLGLHIETLAKNQEYLINAQERSADMMERQAIAIERIVTHLNIAPAKESVPEENNTPEKTFKNHYVTTQKTKKETPKPAPAARKTTAKPAPKAVEQPRQADKQTSRQIIRRRKKKAADLPAKEKETTSTNSSKLLSRDKVMDIIMTMRADGATFDQVATRLVELGQPTFSGRGEWHAQTIHRLCNKK